MRPLQKFLVAMAVLVFGGVGAPFLTLPSQHFSWQLFAQVYDELRAIAHSRMQKERQGQTLQSTELVHEAYLRLSHGDAAWQNRGHFFAAAAE